MKIEISFLAALVLIGTTLLARMAAQGVEQVLFSTVIEYWLYGERQKVAAGPGGWSSV
ncbi:MAG TPA: hypothetical protein VJ864_02560 [Candidatus Binatia bacterium]|nr:hypothetical protein [Candidatus Binatia bacterium]